MSHLSRPLATVREMRRDTPRQRSRGPTSRDLSQEFVRCVALDLVRRLARVSRHLSRPLARVREMLRDRPRQRSRETSTRDLSGHLARGRESSHETPLDEPSGALGSSRETVRHHEILREVTRRLKRSPESSQDVSRDLPRAPESPREPPRAHELFHQTSYLEMFSGAPVKSRKLSGALGNGTPSSVDPWYVFVR